MFHGLLNGSETIVNKIATGVKQISEVSPLSGLGVLLGTHWALNSTVPDVLEQHFSLFILWPRSQILNPMLLDLPPLVTHIPWETRFCFSHLKLGNSTFRQIPGSSVSAFNIFPFGLLHEPVLSLARLG